MTPLRRLSALAAALVAAVALAGCAGSAPATPSPSATSTFEQDIPYRSVDGTDLLLNACLPGGGEPRGAVVVVHGGAFEAGDRDTMTSACRYLADNGFAAFAVDYRLVPSVYPAQVEDVSAAVSWVRDPAQQQTFGLNGDVSILGSSAGAIIALSTAAALSDQGAPVSSVVALSAAGDLTAGAQQLGTPAPDLEDVVLRYLGCRTVDDCPIAPAASPVTVAAALPPTLLLHGSDELIPLQQADQLEDALTDAGVESDLIVVDGDNHGLQLMNASTRRAVVAFLTETQSR